MYRIHSFSVQNPRHLRWYIYPLIYKLYLTFLEQKKRPFPSIDTLKSARSFPSFHLRSMQKKKHRDPLL